MAVKLIPVKCPECGAMLNIEENRTQAFCSYCGAKVLIHNENEFTYRHVDVADLERAETERAVQFKKMELAEKGQHEKEKIRKQKIKYALIFFASGSFLMILGYILGDMTGNPDSGLYSISMVGLFLILAAIYVGISLLPDNNKKDDDNVADRFDGKIKIPESMSVYSDKSYTAIAAILESAGFTNIKCVALNDLVVGLFDRPGIVDSITINGESIDTDKRYPKDASIVISYHSRG